MRAFNLTEDQAITAITTTMDFAVTQVVDGKLLAVEENALLFSPEMSIDDSTPIELLLTGWHVSTVLCFQEQCKTECWQLNKQEASILCICRESLQGSGPNT